VLPSPFLSELEAKGLRVLWGDLRSSPFVVLHKKGGLPVRSDYPHKKTVEQELLSLGLPNVRKVYFPHRLDMVRCSFFHHEAIVLN